MTAEQLWQAIREQGGEPVFVLDGALQFRAPRGALSELRDAIDEHRDALRTLAAAEAEKAGQQVPPRPATLAVSPASVEEIVARLQEVLPSWLATRCEELIRFVRADDCRITDGDVEVSGNVFAQSRCLVVVGSLKTDGNLIPMSTTEPRNLMVVVGDVECANLVVPENGLLVVGGSVRCTGLAFAASRDAGAYVGGTIEAPVVASGLSAGSFTVGGSVPEHLYGWVARAGDKETASGSGKDQLLPLLNPRACDEQVLDAQVLVGVAAMGHSLLA